MKKVILLFLFLSLNQSAIFSQSKEIPYTLDDRDRAVRTEAKLDAKFDEMEKRLSDIVSYMWMLAAFFTALTAATISFAIWDRRTMIRPFETKVRAIETVIEAEQNKMERLIASLRELAKTDQKVAQVLKQFNLW